MCQLDSMRPCQKIFFLLRYLIIGFCNSLVDASFSRLINCSYLALVIASIVFSFFQYTAGANSPR